MVTSQLPELPKLSKPSQLSELATLPLALQRSLRCLVGRLSYGYPQRRSCPLCRPRRAHARCSLRAGTRIKQYTDHSANYFCAVCAASSHCTDSLHRLCQHQISRRLFPSPQQELIPSLGGEHLYTADRLAPSLSRLGQERRLQWVIHQVIGNPALS